MPALSDKPLVLLRSAARAKKPEKIQRDPGI